MSEFDRMRRIARRMGLGREAARDIALQAYDKDIEAGRSSEALRCAEEFRLGEQRISEAAAAVFEEHFRGRRFQKALKLCRGYNLGYGPYGRARFEPESLLGGGQVRVGAGQADALKKILEHFANARNRVEGTAEVLDLLREGIRQMEQDPNREGRTVMLPDSGDAFLLGDLHGSTENLIRGVTAAELDLYPRRHLILQEIVHSRLLSRDQRDMSMVTIIESLRLMRQYPFRVQVLLGNHDLGIFCGKDLIKGGKSLNSFLFRGMEHMFGDRYEEVLELYREFIALMPAAIRTPSGLFMSHSTPPNGEIGRLAEDDFLTDGYGGWQSLRKCREIHAMVNGRDYREKSADAFAKAVGAEIFICGHTPSWEGYKVASSRHLIVDSQHERGCYLQFDLDHHYSMEELRLGLARLNGKPIDPIEDEEVAETMVICEEAAQAGDVLGAAPEDATDSTDSTDSDEDPMVALERRKQKYELLGEVAEVGEASDSEG